MRILLSDSTYECVKQERENRWKHRGNRENISRIKRQIIVIVFCWRTLYVSVLALRYGKIMKYNLSKLFQLSKIGYKWRFECFQIFENFNLPKEIYFLNKILKINFISKKYEYGFVIPLVHLSVHRIRNLRHNLTMRGGGM